MNLRLVGAEMAEKKFGTHNSGPLTNVPCLLVFTHGARRAKVARSLTDARGVRMTHAEARFDPTNPPPLRIRSPRGPP